MTSTPRTLAEEITVGLSMEESLRISLLIADRLRQAHEDGRTHGALSPAAVALEGNDVRLLTASGETRYAAPEVLHGEAADPRSDIYSFGAILVEMLNHGEGGAEGARIVSHPAAVRLTKGCLAQSPDGRFQEVRKLMVDLRLLASAARRSVAAPSSAAPAPEPPAPIVRFRPYVVTRPRLDTGAPIAARLLDKENAVVRLGQIADRALQALRQQQASVA